MESAPGRPDSDEHLVARFQGGDEAAYDELVVRHRSMVYRVAYRLLGLHEEADDLAQEAFLRAYQGLDRFRGEAMFRTWIIRIVINLARDARQARRPTLPLDAAGSFEAGGEGASDATLRRQVREAVLDLPPRQRQVLVLKAYEGMTFAEIAQVTDIAIGTAKATFFQAVQSLRARLGIGSVGVGKRPQQVEA